MHTPFTYLVKHIPSGKVYYGLRYAKKCKPDDLWTTYFTSSKDIWKLIESEGQDVFQFEVRRTFSDPKKAIEWEKKVLRRMKVLQRDDFINRNIPGSSMFKHSEETKAKMRKPKGPMSKEHLENLRAAITGVKKKPRTVEHSKKISESKKGIAPFKGKDHPRYGTQKSEEEIAAMKQTKLSQKRKWVNNGEESKFVCSDEIQCYLDKGYVLGRHSNKNSSKEEN